MSLPQLRDKPSFPVFRLNMSLGGILYESNLICHVSILLTESFKFWAAFSVVLPTVHKLEVSLAGFVNYSNNRNRA